MQTTVIFLCTAAVSIGLVCLILCDNFTSCGQSSDYHFVLLLCSRIRCMYRSTRSFCLPCAHAKTKYTKYLSRRVFNPILSGWVMGGVVGGRGGKYGRLESANKRSACLKVSGSWFLLLGPNEGSTNSHCITLNPWIIKLPTPQQGKGIKCATPLHPVIWTWPRDERTTAGEVDKKEQIWENVLTNKTNNWETIINTQAP